jgi:hypothetical protein
MDTIKVHLQMKPGLYRGMLDCAGRLIATGGVSYRISFSIFVSVFFLEINIIIVFVYIFCLAR